MRSMVRATILSVASRLRPERRWQFSLLRHAFHVARISAPHERTCNICGNQGYFEPFGIDQIRPEARCPGCGSLERHRLFKLWLEANPLNGKRVLHFAPEPAVRRIIEPLAATYLSGDLSKDADRVLDIEAIDLPDGSFDSVLCFHVLEHVDDRKALAELYRVLSPGGVAVLMFPIVEGWETTYENADALSAEDRKLHFGQHDHVRFYGADVQGRIRAAGFRLNFVLASAHDLDGAGAHLLYHRRPGVGVLGRLPERLPRPESRPPGPGRALRPRCHLHRGETPIRIRCARCGASCPSGIISHR